MKNFILKFRFFISLFSLFVAVIAYASANYASAQYPGFSDPGARSGGGTSGAGLIPVNPSVDGGTIPTGATAQVVIRFRNEGAQPVQTGLIRLYPSSTVSAQSSLNQCEEEPLPPGAECAIALSVKALQAGPWRVEMLMSHSGRTRLVTATLSGRVESAGDASSNLATDIESMPSTLDFGSLNSSQTLVEHIMLRNITSNPIDIENIFIDTGEQSGYSMKTECATLKPGQACIVLVTWSPKLRGRSSGVLVINHGGPTALTSVPLSGDYSPETPTQADIFPQAVPGKGLLVSSQTEIAFGDGVETSSTATVSLVNTGDANITLQDIKLSGSDNGLSFKEEGCSAGTVLEPIEACPLTVSWSPSRIGAISDDIQVAHDGARGVLVLPIRGTSTATVSKDQKAIVLSGPQTVVLDGNINADDIERMIDQPMKPRATTSSYSQGIANPASVLDGYKITSFAPTRAIVNGPGGSRLLFDQQEVLLGGVPWFVVIQKNGIEFMHEGQRVLLLFDRSLSSVNRIGASSGGSAGSGG